MAPGAVCLLAAWGVGQLARDTTWITGVCFYIPSVVVAAVLVAIAFMYAATGRRRAALLAAGGALPVVAFVGLIENRAEYIPADGTGRFRVVHWNTAGRPARSGVGEHLLAERADLYVLTDAVNAAHVGVLRDQLGAEYRAATFANLAVVGRGNLRADGWLVDRDGFEVQAVTWAPDGCPITLFVLDLPSSVWVARNPLLREVNALIERHRPDLIVGDFNAPRRSRALTELPAGYAHAYYTAGGGWGATWPVPVPIYDLDHCLHGPRITPVRYRLGGLNSSSDHRYQVFDFSLAAD